MGTRFPKEDNPGGNGRAELLREREGGTRKHFGPDCPPSLIFLDSVIVRNMHTSPTKMGRGPGSGGATLSVGMYLSTGQPGPVHAMYSASREEDYE